MIGRDGARFQLIAAMVLAVLALHVERRWVYVVGAAAGLLVAGLVDTFWPA